MKPENDPRPSVLERLSVRLILLYTFSTGLILALMLCLAALHNQEQSRLHARESFLQLFSSIEGKVQQETRISYAWLNETEQQYRCNIYIEDNGHGLSYKNEYPLSTDMSVLVTELRNRAEAAGIHTGQYPLTSGQSSTGILTLRGEHQDTYLAAVSQINSGENWQNVFVVQELKRSLSDRLLSLSFFVLLFAAGLLLLYALSRFLIQKALAPVRESLQKQKEFIAAASHELRAPLSVLRMNLSVLQKLRQTPEAAAELAESLSDMDAEISRMSKLIEDMLLLASMDASREQGWTLTPVPVEADTFLIGLYEDYEPIAAGHGLTLSLLLPDAPLPVCMADPDRLRQIFSILLDNAFCYAAEGGSLELQAGTDGCLSLIDHGPGIPAEKRRTVFERFSRNDLSRTDRKHYGLGLSIAAELASLHHAALTCEETPGGGCTFRLQLPTADSSSNSVLPRSICGTISMLS